ncbi:MAG: single-stranded DNA-binding protein [Clostridiales bacterium]|nr:single-stranded DNA-binding protein [Clostridiales bacterium]
MSQRTVNNNTVTVVGKFYGGFEFSHKVYGEGFYNFKLMVPRLSDYSDILPVTVSERLIYGMDITSCRQNIIIQGQLRSYNKFVDGSNRLILTIFARDLSLQQEQEEIKNPNQIILDGYVCKSPLYRTTPFGREITDILLAVNRAYGKSDYIPCIAWGRNARFSEKLKVGDRIKIWGRVQSREYQKKTHNGEVLNKVAYEVSISKMERINENNRSGNNDEGVKDCC